MMDLVLKISVCREISFEGDESVKFFEGLFNTYMFWFVLTFRE